MSEISFQIRVTFSVKPSLLYESWLDSSEHSYMTGAKAICSNKEGGEFTAWDEYIRGKNIELIPNKRIVQSWRTSEFNDEDEDSKIVIEFKGTKEGCELILSHSNIPLDQPDYEKGWIEHYFKPMKKYFKSK